MARPHIEFIEVGDVERVDVEDGPLAGSAWRLLSEDDESGAFTAFCSLPKGWSGDLGAYGRPVEIFTVRGELELNGERLGAGCYGYVPSGSSQGALAAREAGQALLMVDPEKPAEPDAPAEVIDPASMYWKSFDPGIGNVPEGILGKVLRIDPDNGDWTWLASCIPGWQSDEAETHPTVEECLMIRGDILLPERGGMKAGSYFWRPAMVKHGPLISRGGGVFFFRTKGGLLSVDYWNVPGWEKMVADYVEQEPYYLATID
jgi:hypothetical protein